MTTVGNVQVRDRGVLRKARQPDLRRPEAYIFTAEDGSAQGAAATEAGAVANAFRLTGPQTLAFGFRIGAPRRGAPVPVIARGGTLAGFVRPVWRS